MDNIKNFEDFLDRMQGLLDNAKKQGHILVRVEDLENTFPELRESEDKKIRGAIIDHLKDYGLTEWAAWLEKQGEQKPTEWCEEDIRNIDAIDTVLFYDKDLSEDTCVRLRNWLKSIKPQNHWKPTEEQMEALNYVVNLMASSESPKENDYYYNVFKDLKKQIRNL